MTKKSGSSPSSRGRKKELKKLPKSLQIGGHKYAVKEVEMDDLGMTDRTKNIIFICKGLPDSQKWATLFHEIGHCINNEVDHITIDLFAEGFYQVMKINKLKL